MVACECVIMRADADHGFYQRFPLIMAHNADDDTH